MTEKSKDGLAGSKPNGVFAPFIVKASGPDMAEYEARMEKVKKDMLERQASDMMSSSSFGNSVMTTPLLFVDPLFDPILLMFPKENIKELYRRLRHYYTYNPFVRNLIDLHSEFALSDFELRCDDKAIERFYNDTKEELGLTQLCVQMNRDYWLLGESFVYGNWNEYDQNWESFRQLPPENVDPKRIYIGKGVAYYLKPDEEIKKVLTSADEASQALSKSLPTEFANAMISGQPYLLDNNRVIHFARKPADYLLRGDSIVKSILKDLLLEDKLRLLQYTFVDRHTHPIKIWKIGSEQHGWKPSKKTLDEFRDMLSALSNDPDGNLVTHPFVKQEFVSTAAMKEDLIPIFKWVQSRILAGLFATDAMVGGSVNPYANQAVSLKVVMHRYMANRLNIEKHLKDVVFRRLAQAREFYKPLTEAELKHRVYRSKKDRPLDIPKFFWQKVNLMNDKSEQELLVRLRDKAEIPFETLADVFGWDPEAITKRLQKEESTPLDPVWRKAREEASKAEAVKKQILGGDKIEDIIKTTSLEPLKPGAPSLKTEAPAGGGVGGAGGRPPLPSGEKKTPETLISNEAMPPREKATEMGTIPTPKGEGGPTGAEEPKI